MKCKGQERVLIIPLKKQAKCASRLTAKDLLRHCYEPLSEAAISRNRKKSMMLKLCLLQGTKFRSEVHSLNTFSAGMNALLLRKIATPSFLRLAMTVKSKSL